MDNLWFPLVSVVLTAFRNSYQLFYLFAPLYYLYRKGNT